MTGVGKTAAGKILAKRLGFDFVDLDEAIEKQAGKSICEIFERQGANVFRDLESQELARTVDSDKTVIALGAGALERDANFALIEKKGTLVYLRTRLNLLLSRHTFLQTRPLLKNCESERDLRIALKIMFERRKQRYERASLIVDMGAHSSAEQTADFIAEELQKQWTATNSV